MQRFPEGSVLPIGKEWGQQDAYLLSDSFLCIRWQESSAHTQQYFMNTMQKSYEILMHFQSIYQSTSNFNGSFTQLLEGKN